MANRRPLELSQAQPVRLCQGRRAARAALVHTKAARAFTTCSQWHQGLISQTRRERPGSWSAGSGDFPGQRPGLGGTEAWAVSWLIGHNYKLRIYCTGRPLPFEACNKLLLQPLKHS